jgi:hypothetical protein
MSGSYDFKIRRGDSFERTIVFIGSNGAPMDITGSTIVLTMDTAASPLTKSYTGDNTGTINLVLTPTETTSLRERSTGTYKIQQSVGSSLHTWLEGATILYGGAQDAPND